MSTQAARLPDLSFLWLEITSKCNLECQHCYANSGPREQLFGQMTTPEWFQVMEECSTYGCQQVQFIGGEPTLHPDLSGMIAYARGLGYSFVEVFTNATRIDDTFLRTLLRHRAHVATSFYTDEPAIHDAITKRQGSFASTIKGIKRMVSAGIPVRAGIIETNLNVGHSSAARRLLERLGVVDIRVDRQRGIGRGALGHPSEDAMRELCGECWKGKLCVTASGATYPCVFSRFTELGSAKSGIGSVLCGSVLSQFRTALRTFKIAQTCDPNCHPICSPCGPDSFRWEDCSPVCQPALAECAPSSGCSPNCAPSSTCLPDRFSTENG